MWGLVVALGLVVAVGTAQAGPPEGFALATVAAGFEQATAFAFAPDGRVFVTEKPGRVKVVDGGTTHLFLDLTDEVSEIADRGLLGVAVDPEFAANGFVYVAFSAETTSGPRDTATPAEGKVVRFNHFAGAPNAGDPASRAEIVTGFPVHELSHVGGGLRFDAAGRLLASFGDGSSFYVVDQRALATLDVDTLSGKIVRVDRATGAGVAGNPWFDAQAPTATRSKVVARGFRNPFRFSVDPTTGDLWVGDVGWNAWEELNRVPAVSTDPERELDFGWPCREGAAPQDGYAVHEDTAAECARLHPGGTNTVGPVFAYPHTPETLATGVSITGGPVYPGGAYPADYVGRIFVGDYAADTFRTVARDGTALDFGTPGGWGAPVDIQLAPSGNVAYLGIGDGTLHEIVWAGGNRPPIAVAAATPSAGRTPLRVRFSSVGSHDPDGGRLVYHWDFGDGATDDRPHPTHRYRRAGTWPVRLTVTEPDGTSATAELRVFAGGAPPRVRFAKPTPRRYAVGDTLEVAIRARAAESVSWQAVVHHLGHRHFLASREGARGSLVIPDHGDDSYIELRATIRDARGATAEIGRPLRPRTARVRITTIPPGGTVVVDGTAHPTPYAWRPIVGSAHSITAPSQGDGMVLRDWSNGGASSQVIVVPPTGLDLIATFAPAT